MDKIKFEDWKKLDLRVGEIKSVKNHPSADKLYILMVRLGKGEHEIQLVAGLKNFYKEDELINNRTRERLMKISYLFKLVTNNK